MSNFPLHSALFLLAAAGCLPFNDAQVRSGEHILSCKYLLLSETCVYEQNFLVLPFRIKIILAYAKAFSTFRRGTFSPSQCFSAGPYLLPRAVARWPAERWPLGAVVGAVSPLYVLGDLASPCPSCPSPTHSETLTFFVLSWGGLICMVIFTSSSCFSVFGPEDPPSLPVVFSLLGLFLFSPAPHHLLSVH